MSDFEKVEQFQAYFEKAFGEDVLIIFAKIQTVTQNPVAQKALVAMTLGSCIDALRAIDNDINPAKYCEMPMIDYYDEIFTGMKASQELHEKRKAVIDKLKETTPYG